MTNRPNIVLIVTDQQRIDTVGAYGAPICRTPNIDRLASQGMRFSRAYTPCGLCSPVRGTLLSGVYPHTHEALTNNKLHPVRTQLEPSWDVLTPGLKAQGYRLGAAGKWHVNAEKTPVDFGYDRYISLGDYATRRSELGVPFTNNHNNYVTLESAVETVPAEQSRQAFLADGAIGMIDEFAASQAPFFVRLDFHGPHPPNVVAEPFASMYDPATLPPLPNFDDDLDGKPSVQRIKRRHWGTDKMSWEDWQPLIAHYYGEISLIDAQIGRVVDHLDTLGIADDTVVIYTTDHGDTMGAHRIWNKDYTMYDEIYHVPLVVRWPGITPSEAVCDEYTHHFLDLTPTILDIAGGSPPAHLQGMSLLPLLRGDADPRPREAFCEFHGCHMGLYSLRMLQTDRWKYIFHTNDIDELYDHDNDPHELINLAESPDHSEPLADLRSRLVDQMARTEDHLYNEWVVYFLTDDLERAALAPGRMNTPW